MKIDHVLLSQVRRAETLEEARPSSLSVLSLVTLLSLHRCLSSLAQDASKRQDLALSMTVIDWQRQTDADLLLILTIVHPHRTAHL